MTKREMMRQRLSAMMTRGPVPRGCPGCGPKRPPGLLRKMANYALALVRHARDRFRRASDATQFKRLSACLSCDRCVRGRCVERKCGCPVMKKVRWKSETCPLGKWAAGPLTNTVTVGGVAATIHNPL
jgi:hypothetical protein